VLRLDLDYQTPARKTIQIHEADKFASLDPNNSKGSEQPTYATPSDWDFFASETGDPAWGYESVLDIYRHIEDWQGHRIQDIAEPADRYLSSRCSAIRHQPFEPCLRETDVRR